MMRGQARTAPFMARLHEALEMKGAPIVVGLDPRPELFPPDVWPARGSKAEGDDARRAAAGAIVRFNELILDAVQDLVVAVKPQLAFYERWGWPGIQALEGTIRMAQDRGLLVVVDGKRNDIGATADAYAQTYLGPAEGESPAVASGLEADALTVNPYLGSDSLAPFVSRCRTGGKALFVLVRTSNPSGDELQGLPVAEGTVGAASSPRRLTGPSVADRVADLVAALNEGMDQIDGFGPIGAVVGATRPDEARRLRERLPGVLFLVPGYGAQGAGAAEAQAAFDEAGRGALVNSARGILYAWRAAHPRDPGTSKQVGQAARDAAAAMGAQLRAMLLAR